VFIAILLIVSVFTGMATGFDLFYRLSYILAATVIVGYVWTLLMHQSLDLRVTGRPRQARVGDEILETITIDNHSVIPKYALEVSEMANIPGHSGGVAISVPWTNSLSWTMRIQTRTRGVYDLGPISVVSRDLFNIFSKQRPFGERHSVTVLPKVLDLPGFEVPAAQLYGDSSTRQRSPNVTPHASSIRDYAPGDALSRVHWNSTARMGKLMSKEFDLGRASEVWILLDLERSVQAGELEESTDEYAVTIAASLTKRHLDSELPVGLVAIGDERYFLPAETGAGQFDRIMQYLALAKAEGDTPLDETLADYEPLWGHNATLVVITSSPKTDWIVGVSELMRRGVRTAVIQLDLQSFGGVADAETSSAEMFSRGIPSYHIQQGDDIAAKLSGHLSLNGTRPAQSRQEVLSTA
jgi:uncharacterized protein (DUF58 family)